MKSILIRMEGKTTALFLKLKNGSIKKKKKLRFRVFTGSNGLKTCFYILYLSASQITAEEKKNTGVWFTNGPEKPPQSKN